MNEKQIRILTTPQDYGGVSWARVKLFHRTANRLKIAKVQALEAKFPSVVIEEMFRKCDVFHVRFNGPSILNVMKRFKANYPHKLMVFDTDDDIHNVNPFNSAYERFGTKDVIIKGDDKPLWTHGQAKFDKFKNRRMLIDYEECLHLADAVITTTPRLANTLKRWNDTTVIIPNSLDLSMWRDIKDTNKKKNEIRMVYSGGSSHYRDLEMVHQAINTLMKKYPNLKWYIVGQHFPAMTRDLDKDRYESFRWIRADGHSWRLSALDLDIGIIPLEDLEFNANKSCNKFYEYSALRIPTIASNVAPYCDEIVDGKNGFLFDTPDEMVAKVSNMIDNPVDRMNMGNKAYDWVKNNRDVNEVVKDWVGFMKKAARAKKKEFVKETQNNEMLK